MYSDLAVSFVWKAIPFANFDSLYQTFVQFIKHLNTQMKKELIRSYPDLTGKLLEQRKLSNYFHAEQRKAGLSGLSNQEITELENLNNFYKKKSNFTFILCATENTKYTIINALKTQINDDITKEVETALKEICEIAYYRLDSIVYREKRIYSKL